MCCRDGTASVLSFFQAFFGRRGLHNDADVEARNALYKREAPVLAAKYVVVIGLVHRNRVRLLAGRVRRRHTFPPFAGAGRMRRP